MSSNSDGLPDLRQINKSEEIPLTDSDLNSLCPGVPITLFNALNDAGVTLDSILGAGDCGFVLFVQKEKPSLVSGHWLAAIRRASEGTVLLFDPYGGRSSPWNLNRTFISNRQLDALDQSEPHLDNLVKAAGLKPVYSTVRYQRMKEGVNTCGRHCVVRVLNREKSEEEYKEYISKFDEFGLNPDQAVTLITLERLEES